MLAPISPYSRRCWCQDLDSECRAPSVLLLRSTAPALRSASLYCCRAVLLMVPQEGPPVIAMRPSLDNRLLALQRSPALLELVDLASGLCFVHSTHQGRGEILSFFFTETPDTDFVVVTTRAVELNQFAAK